MTYRYEELDADQRDVIDSLTDEGFGGPGWREQPDAGALRDSMANSVAGNVALLRHALEPLAAQLRRAGSFFRTWFRRLFRKPAYCKKCGRHFAWRRYLEQQPCPVCGATWWRDESAW